MLMEQLGKPSAGNPDGSHDPQGSSRLQETVRCGEATPVTQQCLREPLEDDLGKGAVREGRREEVAVYVRHRADGEVEREVAMCQRG